MICADLDSISYTYLPELTWWRRLKQEDPSYESVMTLWHFGLQI
jgi:hypothetical protein